MIQARMDQVLIKPDPPISHYGSGILIRPETEQRPSQRGVVVTTGQKVNYLRVGDIVVFAKLAGFEIEHKGEKFRLMKHTNILYIEK